jgi:hypothetical protein
VRMRFEMGEEVASFGDVVPKGDGGCGFDPVSRIVVPAVVQVRPRLVVGWAAEVVGNCLREHGGDDEIWTENFEFLVLGRNSTRQSIDC